MIDEVNDGFAVWWDANKENLAMNDSYAQCKRAWSAAIEVQQDRVKRLESLIDKYCDMLESHARNVRDS